MTDDPRKTHPDFTPTDPPPRRGAGGVAIPPRGGGDIYKPMRDELAKTTAKAEQAERELAEIRRKLDEKMAAEMKKNTGVSGQMKAVNDGTPNWAKGVIAILTAMGTLYGTVLLTVKQVEGNNPTAQQTTEATKEVRELRDQISKMQTTELLKSIDALREGMAEQNARNVVRDQELDALRSLGIALNGGPPEASWTSPFHFDPPPAGTERTPIYRTAARYPGDK